MKFACMHPILQYLTLFFRGLFTTQIKHVDLKICYILVTSLLISFNAYSLEIKKLSLPSIPDLTRTDIYYIQPRYEPVACLVMCPGVNGSGEYYLARKDLQEFADHYRVALVGLSFASDEDGLKADNKGYYYTNQGSGQLLLDAIDQHISKGIPLILYGFSGGAHFVSSFEENYPKRVMAWCAYSAGWWEDAIANESKPPGIIACGKLDTVRYAQSLIYFQEGRKFGKPWCWVSLAGTEHAENNKLDRFVQVYFGSILDKTLDEGGLFDIKTKQKLDGTNTQELETSVWLPSNHVADLWSALHNP
jgi:pimeloyl-ACP methyl ester carboxylesterase